LRELQKAQQQRKARADASERTARVQEEALERLKKLKLEMESKERENMVRIQKVRKAAVERLMENRRKEQEKAVELEKAAAETVKPVVEKKPVEAAELQSSGMIFPKLDKESPASSTHEAVDSPSKSENTIIAPASENSDEEFFEDAESVEIRSLPSDDEGFMTDEEYDILDASDEDFQQ
jgi:next-to-BRCA1 protein 1